MADNTARAKQFMPFAALRGYYAMVLAKNRVVEPRRELIGDAAERLSRKLGLIKKGMMITVRFYRTDAYDTITGLVTRIDPEYRYITIVKTKIPFDDITDVSSADIPEEVVEL